MRPESMLEGLWVAAGTHLWQSSLVLVALLVVAGLMKRAPARVVNALLLMGLAKLLVPLPFLKSVLGNAVDSVVNAAAGVPVISIASPVVARTSALLDPADPAGVSVASGLQLGLTVLWFAGTAALLAFWAAAARRSGGLNGIDLHSAPSGIAARAREAIRGTRIPVSSVIVTREPVVPHVSGLFRPRIVVPEALVRGTEADELRCIMLHEDAHRRRREPLRLLLIRAASAVFFFYPLVWPLVRRLRDTGEMACDDDAIAAGAEPRAYARALSSVIEMGLTAAPSSAAIDRNSPSLLSRRLERLREPWRYKMRARHHAVVLVAAVCVLLASVLALTSVAGDPTTQAAAPEPPAKPAPVSEPAPEAEPEPETTPLPEEFYIKDMVPPEYPEEAKRAGVEAIMFVELSIDDSHKVVDADLKTMIVGYPPLEIVKIDKSGQIVDPVEEEGMEVYHDAFVEAAMEAVHQWSLEVKPENARYENPAAVVPIQFRLDGDKDETPGKVEE